jgi:hypothetical protein
MVNAFSLNVTISKRVKARKKEEFYKVSLSSLSPSLESHRSDSFDRYCAVVVRYSPRYKVA